MVDARSARMFDTINTFDLQCFNGNSFDLANTSKMLELIRVGLRLLQTPFYSLCKQSALFGANGPFGDMQMRTL